MKLHCMLSGNSQENIPPELYQKLMLTVDKFQKYCDISKKTEQHFFKRAHSVCSDKVALVLKHFYF